MEAYLSLPLLHLQNFQLLVAKIERDAVWWLHETVPRMYRPSPAEFVHALHKVLQISSCRY